MRFHLLKFIFFSFVLSFNYHSSQAQDINMQNGTVTTCSGTFYDSGGPDGDYNSNENFVYTICPDDPNLISVIEFIDFETPGGTDILNIYDGDDTSAPQIGQLTGNEVDLTNGDSPIEFTGSEPDQNLSGCLTFEFISDSFLEIDGWEANISCQQANSTLQCPVVNVSNNCSDPNTTDLTADFPKTGMTDTYEVTSIPYVNPYPFTSLNNQIFANQDDTWSDVINLPFDFCFFGDVKNEIVASSNGLLSFDSSKAGGYNYWNFSPGDTLPTSSVQALEGNIMLAHDINPSFSSSNPEIGWEIIGQAPCRTFVLSFSSVAFYVCDDKISTFQIVLHETTNIIDFYIDSKPNGCAWNDDLAVLGIQNDAGTVAFTPPGRNTGSWSATQEAWRFVPDGTPNYTFSWYDSNGAFLSSNETINVPVQDDSYTAEVVYDNCNGDQITFSKDVTTDSDDCTLGINESNKLAFEIYPNPFQENINLSWDNTDLYDQLNISVYSIDGKKVFDNTFEQKPKTLNLPQLSTGMYLIKMSSANQTSVKRIIKK